MILTRRLSRRRSVASAIRIRATQPRRGKSVSAIAAEDVSKHWTTPEGKVHAVDGITFAFDAGTLTVLLGPSGCGKSTTLRLIAGLERADARTHPDRRPGCHDLPPAQRNVSMVFQSYALFPHLSVAENIVFGLKVRGRAGRRATRGSPASPSCSASAKLLDRKPVAALRRPAAARGARPRHRRRGAGLPDGRAALQSRRPAAPRDAPRDPRAAAAARHDHGLRHARSDRGHDHGRPGRAAERRQHRAGRPPAELYERPATVFTARFIGTPPMNCCARGGPRRRGGGRHRRPGGDRRPPRRADAGAAARAHRLAFERGVRAIVESVEYLGADTLVSCRLGTAASRCAPRAASGCPAATRRRSPGRRRRSTCSTIDGARVGAPERQQPATQFA